MVSNLKGVLVPAQYVRAFGPAAGILLGQIAYWHTKAKAGQSGYIVKRWGHRWLARSRHQLQFETGLTASQLKSALKVLSTEQIIIVEQHLFGNKNISHIRFGPEGHNWVGEMLPLEEADLHQTEMAKFASSIKNEISLEINGESGVPCTHALSGKKEEKKEKQNQETETACLTPSSVSVSAKQLEQIYRTAFEETYKEEYLAPFGPKELGQIKQFAAKCPPGAAQAVLDYAVRHWPVVSNLAASAQGAYNIPSRPTVGFMLWSVQSMVNGYRDAKKPAKPKKFIPPKPPASIPPPVVHPDDMPVTDLDTVAKMLGIADYTSG